MFKLRTKIVKFSLFNHLDIWIFTIDPDYRNIVTVLFADSNLLQKTDFHQKYSDLSVLSMQDSGGPFLAKKIKPQRMADNIRRYLGQSQARREFRSSLLFKRLNISCPTPILYGTNISPFGAYESLFLCRYIPHHQTGTEFLSQCQDPTTRKTLFHAVAKDLAVIHGNGLFHKDSHFGNILCNPQNISKIYWIDNDVKKTGNRFDVYEKIALERFQKVLKKNLISSAEWEFFVDCYRDHLTQS